MGTFLYNEHVIRVIHVYVGAIGIFVYTWVCSEIVSYVGGLTLSD